MSKGKQKIDLSRQGSLLDYLKRVQTETAMSAPEGSFDVADRLRIALTQAIKQCPLTRWEIAGRMSALLGREITKFQLDAWTAESKDGHRFPAEYLPAFCAATGCREPLSLLAQVAGMFALPGPDALRAEIKRLDEEERRLRSEKRKREVFLREMEEKR